MICNLIYNNMVSNLICMAIVVIVVVCQIIVLSGVYRERRVRFLWPTKKKELIFQSVKLNAGIKSTFILSLNMNLWEFYLNTE